MKFLFLLLLLGCSTIQVEKGEFQPKKACILSYDRISHNRLFERVLIVGEANGEEWIVQSVDNPIYKNGKLYTYPQAKSEISLVGMPNCPSEIWGERPQTIYDLNRQKENQ